MIHWGVDSDEVVTASFIGGVTQMGGTLPSFWGRYIGGNTRVGRPLTRKRRRRSTASAFESSPRLLQYPLCSINRQRRFNNGATRRKRICRDCR
jgi:hypothetical protein